MAEGPSRPRPSYVAASFKFQVSADPTGVYQYASLILKELAAIDPAGRSDAGSRPRSWSGCCGGTRGI
jgi:hypothetical protein